VVLEEAVRQAREWLDAGRCIPVAVNLSARLLTDLELPLTVEHILRAHGLPAELLTLEVTESTIMNDPTRAGVICAKLRALGVRLAIDDYGAGYSSLSYLCNLEANELKIDKSFIAKLANKSALERLELSRGEQAIVRSTIELGRSLGMTVVAEGVEGDDVWRLLTALGCDLIQGYALTPPLLAGAFEMWLATWEQGLSGAVAESARTSRASEVSSC
jgi:EAL domain-containing protein (putative c-di-GMP-specific phosphodiesterase class I)